MYVILLDSTENSHHLCSLDFTCHSKKVNTKDFAKTDQWLLTNFTGVLHTLVTNNCSFQNYLTGMIMLNVQCDMPLPLEKVLD